MTLVSKEDLKLAWSTEFVQAYWHEKRLPICETAELRYALGEFLNKYRETLWLDGDGLYDKTNPNGDFLLHFAWTGFSWSRSETGLDSGLHLSEPIPELTGIKVAPRGIQYGIFKVPDGGFQPKYLHFSGGGFADLKNVGTTSQVHNA